MATERGSTTLAIRRAHQSDAVSYSDFAARLFRATYINDTSASDLDAYILENFSKECQEAEIADASAAVFLAIADDDLIVGYAHVILNIADKHAAFLNRIYVDAAWRGRGLANQLLDTVTTESKERGATYLELTVYERNARAIAFYKRTGFTETGSTTFTVGDDLQTDIAMKLDLADWSSRKNA